MLPCCCGWQTLTYSFDDVVLVSTTYIWDEGFLSCTSPGLAVNELLYFRVISPEEIGYIFSAAPAKDFGGVFVSTFFLNKCPAHASTPTLCLSLIPYFAPQTSSYDEIFLVPADPADGCSDMKDTENIQGQVILVERGYVLQHTNYVNTCGSWDQTSWTAQG